jgi:uridine kinase
MIRQREFRIQTGVVRDRPLFGLELVFWILWYNAPVATLAHSAEQALRKRQVEGSIPSGGSPDTPPWTLDQPPRITAAPAPGDTDPLGLDSGLRPPAGCAILTRGGNADLDRKSPTWARPVTIGVAGGTGAGKTTVSEAVIERAGAGHIAIIPHDAYYRDLCDIPRAQRKIINFDHPDSLETSLLIQHIEQLKRGEPVDIPVYDFTAHSRADQTRHVEPQPVILVEGILIFAEPQLRGILDVKIFVDTDPDIRFIRRLKRDIAERGRTVESVIEQYLTTVRPMHMEFVEPSKRYADVIIPEGGYNLIAIDMIAARIRALLEEASS